ncbi:MAG: hypothetical protein JW902_13825 [Syntrophaceae bacterium]|nr:hypothetical protein [Syntrophaceae bacterium]
MKKNNKFLFFAIPLALILFGLTVYEYGYLRVRSELTRLEELTSDKKQLLSKYMQLIAEKPQIESILATSKETRTSDKSKIVEGQTPSVASATMQNTLNTIVVSRGGTISSERIEKPEPVGKFQIITVALDGVIPDVSALTDILYEIETQSPYLVVRQLDVSVRSYRDPKDLTIRMKLSGITEGK